MTPLYSGELQFVSYTDSSRGGPRVTFRLQDRDDLQRFVGVEGKRLMAVLVLIGDDETPEPPPANELKGGELAKLAGMLCGNPAFQSWLGVNDSEEARQQIIKACGITSRAELDHNEDAAQVFHRKFRIPFAESRKAIAQEH